MRDFSVHTQVKTHQISMSLQPVPEVLERVLRVVRHRGFSLVKLEVETQDVMSITMTVASERDVILLSSQLDKLIDTIECRVLSAD